MTAPHPEHGAEELCPAGAELYARALREGHVSRAQAKAAPCLPALGLLRPAVADLDRLEPVPAAVALQELLRVSADRIAGERRREARLARAFGPLLRAGADLTGSYGETPDLRVHSGLERINAAISQAMAEASEELLSIQPHVAHRGIAFVPANQDRTLALEIRIPALVGYLVTVFDRFWHLATPLYPLTAQQPSLDGITPRQRAIAALLVEDHTDAATADRLGMNIRTARLHIAKLAATLGCDSRAQLGHLIGQSGMLGQHREVGA